MQVARADGMASARARNALESGEICESSEKMQDDINSILCDPSLLAVREYHMDRLTRLFNGERLDRVVSLAGIGGVADLVPGVDPRVPVEAAVRGLAEQADRARDRGVFRPLCLEAWLCGVHFVDRVFGAHVHRDPDARPGDTGGWWNDSLDGAVGELRAPDLVHNAAWAEAVRLGEAMAGACEKVVFVASQVLSSPLNIAVNLYGERFLVALNDAPGAAARDLGVIAGVIGAMHRWYQGSMPPEQFQPVVICGRCQPRGFGQICGCTTHLLSAECYRALVAPHDAAILGLYPHGGMIHLCGAHAQHIPVWRQMKELRAVQINDRAAEDLALYFRGLRDDQIIYWSPTVNMSVEDALRITRGRRLVIAADLPEAPPAR